MYLQKLTRTTLYPHKILLRFTLNCKIYTLVPDGQLYFHVLYCYYINRNLSLPTLKVIRKRIYFQFGGSIHIEATVRPHQQTPPKEKVEVSLKLCN